MSKEEVFIERKIFKNHVFNIHNYYEILDILGLGTYGVVIKVKDTRTNQECSIKKILSIFDNKITALRTYREIKLLKSLNHENVLSLNDLLISEPMDTYNDIYLITDKMDTDLKRVIYSEQEFPMDIVKYIAFELARGINYLHYKSVMHRDLKPGNILINSNCDIKICDFGLAKPNYTNCETQWKNTPYVTTRWYRAPEIIFCFSNYTTQCDVWSYGCILAEMLLREPLFKGSSQRDQLEIILELLGDPPKIMYDNLDSSLKLVVDEKLVKVPMNFNKMFPMLDETGVDLLKKILTIDPIKRIKSSDILKHPFFKEIWEEYLDPQSSILPEDGDPISKDAFAYEFGLDLDRIDFREPLYKECINYLTTILNLDK